jgi:hypothetical protein
VTRLAGSRASKAKHTYGKVKEAALRANARATTEFVAATLKKAKQIAQQNAFSLFYFRRPPYYMQDRKTMVGVEASARACTSQERDSSRGGNCEGGGTPGQTTRNQVLWCLQWVSKGVMVHLVPDPQLQLWVKVWVQRVSLAWI